MHYRALPKIQDVYHCHQSTLLPPEDAAAELVAGTVPPLSHLKSSPPPFIFVYLYKMT